ncbi:transcriptional regulator [uncultured Pleomorphomonas sp.]|uniref:transcriptional regulator n=1 Tax=uncultured Pleomorphomonas sp. TaxID=442121 RepID=UPI0025837F12|nr:transcriptional regulator [uncultured Pleomorphomonas sp.]
MMAITGAQIRAARALIRWTADDLAKAASLGVMTIRRAEAVDGEIGTTAANALAIRSALETAGVVFVDANGEGPGVRLKKVHG